MPTVTLVQPRNLDRLKALIGPGPGAIMSARKVARDSAISHQFMCFVLAGKRTTLSAEVAHRIAATIGVKPTVLWRAVPSNGTRVHIKQKATL